MNKTLLCILFMFSSKASSKGPPSCLDKFCINMKQMKEKDMIRSFGKNFSVVNSSSDHSKRYCFRIRLNSIFSYLEIAVGDERMFSNFNEVKLSSENICESDKISEVSHLPATPEGISLGSKAQDLLKLYGKPTWTITPPFKAHYEGFFGEKSKFKVQSIICYSAGGNDSLHSLFYISEGLVSGINISTQP